MVGTFYFGYQREIGDQFANKLYPHQVRIILTYLYDETRCEVKAYMSMGNDKYQL